MEGLDGTGKTEKQVEIWLVAVVMRKKVIPRESVIRNPIQIQQLPKTVAKEVKWMS